jgi:hypothetical protein
MATNKKMFGIIAGITFLCALVFGCGDGNETDPLKKVEKWIFTRYAGTVTGGAQEQFDPYANQFLTEYRWNNIKSYSKQDPNEGDTYVTWYGVVSWMTAHGFSTEVIDMLKDELASYERAIYFY